MRFLIVICARREVGGAVSRGGGNGCSGIAEGYIRRYFGGIKRAATGIRQAWRGRVTGRGS